MSDNLIYRVITIEDFLNHKGEPVHWESEINTYSTLSAAKGMRTRKLAYASSRLSGPGHSYEVRIESSPLVWTPVVV
jgi:hypothetical protein